MSLPVRTYERRGRGDAATLVALARAEEAGRIVVGLPLSLSGEAGPQARAASAFADELRSPDSPEVVLWDERLSSREADHYLQAAGRGGRGAKDRRAAKEHRDAIAASIILQAYLDSHRAGALPPLPPIE